MDDDAATMRALMGNWVREIEWDKVGKSASVRGKVNAAGFGFHNNFAQTDLWLFIGGEQEAQLAPNAQINSEKRRLQTEPPVSFDTFFLPAR